MPSARTVDLNPRHGWLGWWPKGGWRTVLDPENGRIPAFLEEEARRLSVGSAVLDAGAGRRPFAVLFRNHRYESCDMPQGFYPVKHDFECFLNAIPRPDQTYNVVVLTQVLEHVPDPEAVLRELHRILKPGGRIFLTVPLTAPLHSEPWNFFQFTQYALAELARRTDFDLIRCEKIGGAFWVLGKRLPDAFRKLLKQYDPTRARKRGQNVWCSILLTILMLPIWLVFYPLTAFLIRPLFYWMDRLDLEKSFTLGFTAVLMKEL